MTPDRDLTILLTVKDRVPFTFRWLSYLNSIQCPFRVLIADGGSDERVARALSDGSRFPHVQYEYVRYPYDASYTDYYAKVDDALSRIQTPFVALADNDDFFVVSGLREAVRFLGGHADYATCGGQCAVFWVGSSRTTEQEDLLSGQDVVWKCGLDTQSLSDGNARERLRNQSLCATYPVYYHVQRTGDARTRFRIVRESDPKDLMLLDYLLSFLTAIAGKTKQLDTLYIARQWNTRESASGVHLEKCGDWLGRMLVPSWSADFTNFVQVASTALADQDGIDPVDARASVIEAYRMLTAPVLLSDVLKEPTVTVSMLVGVRLVRRLLAWPAESLLRRMLRTAYRRIPWISADAVHGTEFRGTPVANAAQAIGPICEFLTRKSGAADPAGAGLTSEPLET